MTFTATPQPSNVPPRVRLDIDSDDAGAAFTELEVKRDGTLIREQPFTGGPEALAFDYEAPFGVSVTYTVEGSFIPTATPDWTESWASLASWTGDTGDFSVAAGKVSSSVLGAEIVRTASGTIQRVEVTDPDYVRVELLTAGDVVVCSVALTTNVVLTGTTSSAVSGSGSFALTLSDGVATANAADASWSASRPYSGVPTKVRVASLYPTVVPDITWSTTGYSYGVAVDSSGNIYAADTSSDLIRKYNSSGVEVVAGGFPVSTVRPISIAVDSSGNIYVGDDTNNLIRKYNSSGVAGITFSTVGNPHGVAVDSSGNIYVTDTTNDLVRKYDSSGVAGITWTTTNQPGGIAVDSSSNIYITDTTSRLVRKYNSSGVAGITFSTVGVPNGVAVDSSGNIYAGDRSSDLIRKYNSSGVQVVTFSAPSDPYTLAVDSTGNVYVDDVNAYSIRKFVPKTASTDDIVTTLVTTETLFSATITTELDVDEAWLIHPSQPSLSCSIDPGPSGWREDGINVDVGTKPNLSRRQVATTFNPVGRSRSVVVTHGNRLAGDWTLNLMTPRLADRDTVQAIITDQTPLLLRAPSDWGWDLPDGWYSVGDVDEGRMFQSAGLQQTYRNIVLPLTPVDAPINRQGALWTWGGVLVTYETWEDVRAANATWLDLLAGPEA